MNYYVSENCCICYWSMYFFLISHICNSSAIIDNRCYVVVHFSWRTYFIFQNQRYGWYIIDMNIFFFVLFNIFYIMMTIWLNFDCFCIILIDTISNNSITFQTFYEIFLYKSWKDFIISIIFFMAFLMIVSIIDVFLISFTSVLSITNIKNVHYILFLFLLIILLLLSHIIVYYFLY